MAFFLLLFSVEDVVGVRVGFWVGVGLGFKLEFELGLGLPLGSGCHWVMGAWGGVITSFKLRQDQSWGDFETYSFAFFLGLPEISLRSD